MICDKWVSITSASTYIYKWAPSTVRQWLAPCWWVQGMCSLGIWQVFTLVTTSFFLWQNKLLNLTQCVNALHMYILELLPLTLQQLLTQSFLLWFMHIYCTLQKKQIITFTTLSIDMTIIYNYPMYTCIPYQYVLWVYRYYNIVLWEFMWQVCSVGQLAGWQKCCTNRCLESWNNAASCTTFVGVADMLAGLFLLLHIC